MSLAPCINNVGILDFFICFIQEAFLSENPALILTAGSDYHGTNKKNNFLGISYALNLLPEQKEQFNQITTNAYNFFIKL